MLSVPVSPPRPDSEMAPSVVAMVPPLKSTPTKLPLTGVVPRFAVSVTAPLTVVMLAPEFSRMLRAAVKLTPPLPVASRKYVVGMA